MNKSEGDGMKGQFTNCRLVLASLGLDDCGRSWLVMAIHGS